MNDSVLKVDAEYPDSRYSYSPNSAMESDECSQHLPNWTDLNSTYIFSEDLIPTQLLAPPLGRDKNINLLDHITLQGDTRKW